MNLKQKTEYRNKIESLEELLKCVDSSLIYENSDFSIEKVTNMMLADLQSHVTYGDNFLALNLLLRMLKKLTVQIKGELSE